MSRTGWALAVGLIAIAGAVWMSQSDSERTAVSLVISRGTVVTMDAVGTVIVDGAVAIDGQTIVAVGTSSDIEAAYSGREWIDARDQVIMPGLINTHTHAPMVLFRGLADDLALMDWLNDYIFPAEKLMVTPQFVRVGTRLAALEMIESGTTTYADMYYFEEEIAATTREAGLRGVLGQTIIQFPVPDAETPEAGLARAETFINAWADDDLIVPAVAPHAPYTLSPETLRAARTLANTYDVPLLIHLAETQDEVGVIAGDFGLSPTLFLDSLGLWNGPSLAAHAVWVDDQDMAVLAERGVGLSHNPESNMKLASGTAPVPEWLTHGIDSGLGTDGAASNNDLDMFEAMRTAALLHKHMSGDPRVMPAQAALALATRGGAAALGMADRIGSLEVGKQADIITVSMASARQAPVFDPVSHLVYTTRGSDVQTTIVQGRILMRDRRVLSLDRVAVIAAAHAMGERVSAALVAPGER